MSQREEIIEKQWTKLENRLFKEKYEASTRLIPVFSTAKKHPLLKKLYPFTSHEFLCFSFNTIYPWSEDYPCVGPIPNFSDYPCLIMGKETLDFETSASLLQPFLNRYKFLFEKTQPYMITDENNIIIELPDAVGAVNWILEQTQEMYTVFGRLTTGLLDNDVLGITNTQGAVDLLVRKISSINPDL